jgi:hypothetical protein
MKLKQFIRTGAILVFLCGLASAAGFFLSRPPVLILGDVDFDSLYGPRRLLLRRAELSLRLFRRVKRVSIAEDANPEAAVFAVEGAAARPWAVLGHSRHLRGLEQYAGRHPEIRVIIFREGPAPESEAGGGPEYVFTDNRLNSLRAGRCAAMLAAEEGDILVFQDGRNFPVDQEAFSAGLREEGKALTPVYLDGSADYSAWDRVRCVVLGGPADFYFNRNSAIPALLFSWMDPAFFPSTVKITADDSPWALALRVLEPPGGGENSSGYRILPAEFSLFRSRVGEEGLREKLKKEAHLRFSVSLPW